MNDYLQIANSPSFWITCIPAILMVVFQAVIFTRLAFRASKVTTLTSQQCRTAFRVGATSAIGPAMAIFIVMIGMMAVVGAPMAWLRLNFIGSATTELTATTVGAKAMGVELGSAEYGLTAFSASVWTMTLNGCGWLLFCGLFTDKMDKIMSKFTGGNIALMTAVCGAAALGTASYLATDQALKSAPPSGSSHCFDHQYVGFDQNFGKTSQAEGIQPGYRHAAGDDGSRHCSAIYQVKRRDLHGTEL